MRVAFQVFRHGAWLLDLADGSMLRVLADPTAEAFWAPDGRRVRHSSRRDGRWSLDVLSRSHRATFDSLLDPKSSDGLERPATGGLVASLYL